MFHVEKDLSPKDLRCYPSPVPTNATLVREEQRLELLVKVADWTKRGYTASEIAKALGLTPRTVHTLRKEARYHEDLRLTLENDAVKKGPEHMRPETPEAFEAFFNAYSGMVLQPHSKKFVKAAMGHEQVLINVPVRHAKSEIFSVWLPIWYIARDRDIQILLISQSQPQAMKFSRKIAYNLENNPDLIRDYGRFKPESAVWQPGTGRIIVHGRNRLVKSGDHTLLAVGQGGGITGLEADLLIADDIVDSKNSATPLGREKLAEWFQSEAMSRRQPVSKAWVIGTRWHLADLYADLSAKRRSNGEPNWVHINFPALDGDWETGKPLWPAVVDENGRKVRSMWDRKALRAKYEEAGAEVWAKTYQQNPVPPDSKLVLDEWIYGAPDQGIPGCLDDRGEGEEPFPGPGEEEADRVRVLSIDPATTEHGGLILADLFYNREQFACHVLEAVRLQPGWRRMIEEHLERIVATYDPSPHHFIFEANAAQRFFLEDPTFEAWSRRWDVRIIPHTTSVRKADDKLGFASLAPDFEFGRIRLPWGDPGGKRMSKLLISEATTWPHGSSDDVLMALWFIKFNYGRLRPPYRSKGRGISKPVPPRLYKRPWYQRKTA